MHDRFQLLPKLHGENVFWHSSAGKAIMDDDVIQILLMSLTLRPYDLRVVSLNP